MCCDSSLCAGLGVLDDLLHAGAPLLHLPVVLQQQRLLLLQECATPGHASALRYLLQTGRQHACHVRGNRFPSTEAGPGVEAWTLYGDSMRNRHSSMVGQQAKASKRKKGPINPRKTCLASLRLLYNYISEVILRCLAAELARSW